jgi:hypothetical protein
MNRIVVTVPHASCGKDAIENRKCDRRSEEAAIVLDNALNRRKIEHRLWINTEVGRCICPMMDCRGMENSCIDMNRNSARNTEWRQELRRILVEEKPEWVIDVHSFPQLEETDKLSFGKDAVVVLLLETESISSEIELLYNRLVRLLGKEHALILRGEDNDILAEATELGIKNVLVEVHEDTSILARTMLQKIMDIVASVV